MITAPTLSVFSGVQLLEHHAVYSTLLNLNRGFLEVQIGSWLNVSSGNAPLHLTTLLFCYEIWQPEHLDSLPASIAAHPLWAGTGPAQPTTAHGWNPVALRWDTPAPLPLPELKTTQWLHIKQARESAINAPLATPYGTFDAHAKARASITDAVLMLQTLSAQGTPQTIDWTLADNTVVTLTTAQMVEVGVLLGQQVQAAYTQARSLRVQIEAATTAQEVGLVVWVVG